MTESILGRFPEFLYKSTVRRPLTIKGLGTLLYEKRRAMERSVYSGFSITQDDLTLEFPIGQIGVLGRTAAPELAQLCTSIPALGEFHFKVCLDESECFTAEQQKTINTLVRLSEAPVSFVVSYVRLVDVTQTHIDGITLQDADREIIPLDDITDKEFTQLAEGVATVRMQRLAPECCEFTTRGTFGDLNINELLLAILAESSSPDAQQLLENSRARSSTPFFKEFSDDVRAFPPIYQTYLVDKLVLQVPSPDSPAWERRKQDSAEIRKRMVAAYLCICKEFRTDVKYAGAEMVLQMSDKCIRDYLSFLHSAFTMQAGVLEDFGKRRLPIELQDAAIKDASTKKNDSIPRSEVGSPLETQRLIDALGKLTNRLQTSLRGEKSLKSPERGLFVLPRNGGKDGVSDVIRLILEAAEAGFLKLSSVKDRNVVIYIRLKAIAYMQEQIAFGALKGEVEDNIPTGE